MNCRCDHLQEHHWTTVTTHGDITINCMKCACPEFRALETPETQTLRGTRQ